MPHIIKRPLWHVPESLATDESVYRNRREFLKAAGFMGISAGLVLSGCTPGVIAQDIGGATESPVKGPLPDYERNPKFAGVGRELTREKVATTFNNFYEFSYGKQIAHLAADFKIDPYTLTIDGLVEKPLKLDLDQIEKLGYEERVYRFRCVEAWSMTVPWLGVPLATLLKHANIKAEAKYVAFKSVYAPDDMPNQKDTRYGWPYYEGLSLDEAMNELAFVTTGLYGKRLLPQSGTPLRIVVPWKYGYKGPKSVVGITLTNTKPKTFWSDAVPSEYPFYSNVDPEVPHPRWSQANEKHITVGASDSAVEVIPTQRYNGYGEQVAALYADMPRKLM